MRSCAWEHAPSGNFSLQEQQMSMMNQAVDHCSSHLVVRKYAAQLGKFQVRGQNQVFALIAVRYDTEQLNNLGVNEPPVRCG